MLKDTDIAWLAGIVDGEGCIYGHWNNRGKYASGGNVSVEIRIEATSSAMIMRVAEICSLADIQIVLEVGRFQPRATKPSHRVNIRRRIEVMKFLRLVRPHLVVKTPEADMALCWYERWGDQRGPGVSRASKEEKVIFFEGLRSLKTVA